MSGHYDPIHQAHALEQVVFVAQLNQQAGPESFQSILESVKQIPESEFPGRTEIQSISFIVGTPSAQPKPTTSAGAHGKALFHLAPDGRMNRELRVERGSLTFSTQLYTRWSQVWTEAKKYFDQLLPLYLADCKLTSLSISVIDRFVWVGLPKDASPALLLRAGSKYIAPHVYTASDLWHSHTGVFSNVDIHAKRLLNINADNVDEIAADRLRRSIVFATVLTDLFGQPGYEPLDISAANVSALVDKHMQDMHLLGKKVLGDMINNEMGKRIALV